MPNPDAPPDPEGAPIRQSPSLSHVFGVAVRLLLAIVLGFAIGIAIYAVLAYPAQIANDRVNSLSNNVSTLMWRFSDARATQSNGMAELQGRLGQQEESVSQLQSEVEALQTAQPDSKVSADQLEQMGASLATLQAEAMQTSHRLDAVEQAAGTPNPQLVELSRQTEVLRLMAVVSQARLFLVQGEYGQAGLALDSAQSLATGLAADELPGSPAAEVESRLAMAQQELKSTPLIAAGDLDIAWQLLVELSHAP